MSSSSPGPTTSLQIGRVFQAPREKVFQAWTDPEKLGRWFCHAKPNYSGRVTHLDLHPGGQYRLEIHETNGRVYRLRGNIGKSKAPEKLVFTWFWEMEPQYGETLVTVEFLDRGGHTELILTQERFPTVEARDGHSNGWIFCFDTLERYLGA